MARLLDDLLDASRVVTGKVTLQRQPTKVSDFVAQGLELCRTLVEAQHQRLSVDLPGMPLHVDGDLIRLTQIVGNLVHNAAKYTPDGGLIAGRVKAEDNSVVIKVADNGSGISKEVLPRVFDLFTQEDRSLGRSQGGLGIGLTVARNMVEQHGGTITAHSEGLGMGSEFTVILPRLHHVGKPAIHAEPPLKFKSARILLVDDNVDATTMLSMLFKKAGYEVEVAADGPSALHSFARQQSEIVVCDIGLSGMTGYEVAEQIRRGGQATGSPWPQSPMLIALTGYASEADQAQALACGFNHHLAKPADFKTLLKLIQNT